MLRITKFTTSAPDSDGDIRVQIEGAYVNSSEKTVRLIHTAGVILGSDDTPLEIVTNEELVRLDSGEDASLYLGSQYLKAHLIPESADGLKLRLVANSYARVHAKLGEVQLSARPGTTVLRSSAVIDGIGGDLRVVVSVVKDDDSGNFQIAYKCLLTNLTSQHIYKAILTSDLVDEEDAILWPQTSEIELPVGWPEFVQDSLPELRKGQLRRSRLRLSLSVFFLVGSVSVEAASTQSDDD